MSKENLYEPGCIRTRSGVYIDVFDPKPHQILIEDIAHSLSHQCRFGGHLDHFYSVAQHSVYCSRYGFENRDRKLQLLMHDASEAYLLDMPKPIKDRLPDYVEVEKNLMNMIAKKFGFEWPLDEFGKHVDRSMMELEWRLFVTGETDKRDFFPWKPEIAKETFLEIFKTTQN